MWRAATGHVETMSKLLKAMVGVDKHGIMQIGDDGIKFHTRNTSHTLQSSLFLATTLFASYQFTIDEPVELKLSLQTLVRCLQMYVEWRSPASGGSYGPNANASANCFFVYSKEEEKLEIHYAHDTMRSHCSIKLFELGDEDVSNFSRFDSEEMLLQSIMPAPIFASAVSDLESVQTETICIRGINEPNSQIELLSTSVLANSSFVLPNDARVMEAFLVEGHSTQFSYNFYLFAKIKEGLRHAKRMSLRYDSYGVLCCQCLIEIDDENKVYLEFQLLPLENPPK